MKSFIQHLVEATGPEGRDLSKKVDKHFEEIRGFIGAISGGKANEFQDHVQDGVFSGHDNDTIINNHGPLKNHGMVRSDDGDDYSEDIHDYIDAVRAHHEYKTDVRDDSEDFYMGEGKKNCGCGKDPCITYGKQEMNEAKGDLKDMKDVVKELKAASKMHLGQSKRLAKYLDSLKETYGPVTEADDTEPGSEDRPGGMWPPVVPLVIPPAPRKPADGFTYQDTGRPWWDWLYNFGQAWSNDPQFWEYDPITRDPAWSIPDVKIDDLPDRNPPEEKKPAWGPGHPAWERWRRGDPNWWEEPEENK